MWGLEALLKARQWIQWKTVVAVITFLTILHFTLQESFLFQENLVLRQHEPPQATDVSNFPDTDLSHLSTWEDNAPAITVPSKPLSELPETEVAKTPTAVPSVPNNEHIAVCLSVANQSLELQEWLTHHYTHMNISRFYIMDDGSEPPLSTFEYPGVPRSALTFNYQPRETRSVWQQMVFYNLCIDTWREKHYWMAFIDADEFFDTPGNETLAEVLETFEGDDEIGALGVNWRIHTSGGLLTRQDSCRKAFTTCMYDGEGTHNRHIKTIVKTSHGVSALNPHKFNLREGKITVGEHGDVIDSYAFRLPATRDRIGLAHYVIKSREEFEQKMLRGNGMTDPKDENLWVEFEDTVPHEECLEMVGYKP